MRHLVKIITAAALVLLLTLGALATSLDAISEEDKTISSVASAAIYNIENDTVVFSYNADKVLPTASFTKMMTAVCAYELLSDRLDETITVEGRMIYNENGAYVSGRYVGYYIGEVVKIRDLFCGLLMRGANDSAYMLCYAAMNGADDSVAQFIEYMNKKAVSLGMKDTYYVNQTGLDAEGMVTTANDSLKIATEFYKIDFLVGISNAVSYTIPASNKQGQLVIYNENGLKYNSSTSYRYHDSRVIGINSGMTPSSGNYAASAVRGEELSYVIVVLGGKEINERNSAYLLTSELATKALNDYGYVEVIKTSGIVSEIPVNLSTDADYVTLVPAQSLTLYLPYSVDLSADLTYSYRLDVESLDAPVTEGQKVGSYTVSNDDVLLGSVDLVTKNSVSRSEFLVVLDKIESFTTSTFFIVTVIALVVLTIGYFVLGAVLRARRRNRHYRRR